MNEQQGTDCSLLLPAFFECKNKSMVSSGEHGDWLIAVVSIK